MTITSDENRLTCSASNPTTENGCKWVNGTGDSNAYLSIIPPAPGNYSCQCSATKPCEGIKPISALVYFVGTWSDASTFDPSHGLGFSDPSKLMITTPDGNQNLNIPDMIVANKTNFTLSCNLSSSMVASLALTENPVYSWYRNGKLIYNDSRVSHSFLVFELSPYQA